mmetsp:Transcript_44880/g.120961  ORF Transcript_44880/g.120961 Transcript_44880/m.120961 type:complete len:211 (-) Transcript_44880:225-857(-)
MEASATLRPNIVAKYVGSQERMVRSPMLCAMAQPMVPSSWVLPASWPHGTSWKLPLALSMLSQPISHSYGRHSSWLSGWSRASGSQLASHRKPERPNTMKTLGQPKLATSTGAMYSAPRVPRVSPVNTNATARDLSSGDTQFAMRAWMAGRQMPSAAPMAARQANRAGTDVAAEAGVSTVKPDQTTTPRASSSDGEKVVQSTALNRFMRV